VLTGKLAIDEHLTGARHCFEVQNNAPLAPV
jgi:hypothetical protein